MSVERKCNLRHSFDRCQAGKRLCRFVSAVDGLPTGLGAALPWSLPLTCSGDEATPRRSSRKLQTG